MPRKNSNYLPIFTAIANGATVITANRRLARWLRNAFDSHQQELGAMVWPSADILPWSAWLMRLWNDAQEQAPPLSTAHQRVLKPNQTLALWERIITQSRYGSELLQARTTAQQAQLAWSLIQQWRISMAPAQFNISEDCQAFYTWAQRFSKECAALNAIDDSRLADAVKPFIEQGYVEVAAHILLGGFDALTPQQAQFFAWLEARGHIIEPIENTPQRETPIQAVGLPDAEAEIELAARWATRLLTQNPDCSIGVVVLDLAQSRPQIERIFTEICHPSATLITTNSATRAFNISLGLPLSNYPIIHSALLALRTAHNNPAALDDVSYLLRTPFIAGAEHESCARALFDVWLRERGELLVNLRTLAGTRKKSLAATIPPLPIFFARLAALINEIQTTARFQAPSAWATTFARLLNHLGWPGERALNSEEFQTVAAWQDCLSELASLDDYTMPQTTFNQALSQLEQLASATVFQPKSDPAPIQIMGILETSGLSFDHLWVMGLHDIAWPAPAHPNPFVPLALQQKFGLPHSSSASELIFARTLTQRVWRSAAHIIVSYPLTEGDQTLRPSPLLQDCITIAAQQIECDDQPRYRESVYRARNTETLLDYQAPSLPPHSVVNGGTAVIKHQAACPFSAFARFRLGAKPLPSPGMGLEPRERGTLVHAALERLWQKLGSLAALQACNDTELLCLIQAAAAQALDDMATRRPLTFTAAFLEIEQRRVAQILLAWLALERQRAPFTVAAFEQKQLLTVGQLQFKGKLDRIDRLADGRHVIVDYKTSMSSPGDWFGPRPNEPQLPLYGVFHGDDVAGLIFGQVKLGAMAIRGLASDRGVSPQLDSFSESKYALDVSTWPDLMQHWKTLLEALSENFRLGDARIDPKEPATCTTCHLTALCRVNERGILEVDDHD